MAKKYSWKITFWKGVKYLAFYTVPYLLFGLVDLYPQYASITLGTVAVWLANWLKNHKK